MAANLADHQPIRAVRTISGNTPNTQSINEKLTQTFLNGVPVQLSAGVVQEWDGATIAVGIAGVALQSGSNYSSSGKGAPGAFGSVGPPGTSVTFGSVLFETSAVNIPHGAPIADGRTVFEVANDDTIFEAQIDNSAAGAFASLQTQIGSQFGMTKDATGHWYVDLNKTGGSAVLIVIGFNPNDLLGSNGARAYFQFLNASQQLSA